ncbi:hypothetical protein M0804_004807 [Polistes exclamans]|nr:hypothetical protein M0804_004807 [Polistes exclamans]
MNSEYQSSFKKKIDKAGVQNVEDIKKCDEYKIHTGWKQEWVSPKQLNGTNPMKIREVVRGPFYSPKLLKISPFVSCSFGEYSCDATKYMKKTYGGIPDPWTECLAIKGYCNNDKYSQALKSSCVSRCMRFWITKTVWKKMGLPLIQGIPDPDRDSPNILKPCLKCSSKQPKCHNFQALPRSKSLSNCLEKNITPKNLISSNVPPFSNLIVTNKEKTIKSRKSSSKQPKEHDEKVLIIRNREKHFKNNSLGRKSGGGIYVDSKDKLLSSKGDKKEDNLANKTKDARSNQIYFHSSMNVGTQTFLDRFNRVSCKDSSFQTLLKIARKSILGRKTYKSLKERWGRTRDPNILFEHENQYFSNHVTSCHCKQATKNDISIKIEKELSDKLSTNRVVDNYCAPCKAYFLKTQIARYPCHESVRDRRRRKMLESTKITSHSSSQCFEERNKKPVRENVMIQTELTMQGASAKELRLICSRCNYPYFKVETENRINTSTHCLDGRKDYAFINNTYELNHRFQGKYNDENQSTIPASRLTSKQDDLNFSCLKEYGCIQNAQKNDRKKTRRNVEEMNCMKEKIGKICGNDHVKEKILDFSMKHKELIVEDNGQYADISEQSKFIDSGKLSPVTSNSYLNRRNKALTSSQKIKATNVNKLEAISTDQNTCKKIQLLTSNCNKNTSSKTDHSKIKDKCEEILSGTVSSTIKKEYNKNGETEDLIDYTKSSERLISRTNSKTKSKIQSKHEFTVKRKSKGKSKMKLKSKVKSTYNKSKLNVNSKSNDKSQFGTKSKSNCNSKLRSRSTFKSGSNNKSRSKSRSKFKSKSRSTYMPNSKSKYIQTECRIRSFESLKNLSNNIREEENEDENDRSSLIKRLHNCYRKECTKCTDCNSISNYSNNIERSQFMKSSSLHENPQIYEKIENKDATSSTIGFIFDPGPCVNQNYAIERGTCNEMIDSSDSIYSLMTNFDKNNQIESRKFPFKTNCWFSKSDNYMNSNHEEEKRKKDFLYRKENYCYLQFCNSRYFSDA